MMSIAQADAKRTRLVLSKLKKHGLRSLDTEDFATVLKKVYRVQAIVALGRLWSGVKWWCVELLVSDCYVLSQVGFESLAPVVRAEGIDGNAIGDCADGDDFIQLLPPELQEPASCFKALKAYLERAVPAAQRRVRAGESVLDTVVLPSCSLIMIHSSQLSQPLSSSVQSSMQLYAPLSPSPKISPVDCVQVF